MLAKYKHKHFFFNSTFISRDKNHVVFFKCVHIHTGAFIYVTYKIKYKTAQGGVDNAP